MAAPVLHTADDSDYSGASSIAAGRRRKVSGSTPLTLSDMHTIAADIKSTLTIAIAEEVRGLTQRLDEVVKAGAVRDRAIKRLDVISEHYVTHLITLNRQVGNLNRGRCHNIRVRGVPETVLPDRIDGAVWSIFNNWLGRNLEAELIFDRIHQDLRP